MTIKITRNEAANCINFVGSTNPAYFNACLSAEVNAEDSTRFNVINDIRTSTSPTTQYEFYAVEYTDFSDKDGNVFVDAQAAVDYVNENANVANNTGRFQLGATDTIDFSVDPTETTVLLGNGDAYAVNSIRASANDDGHIDIIKHSADVVIYGDLRLANASIGGVSVTQVLATAVNELNALFAHTGGAAANLPVVTSSTAISLTEGDSLNYELTATYGVGYEWDLSNVSGVTTVEGNVRKLIGGSSLAVGSYNIPVKAINYNGEDSETVVLTVNNAPFSDTKSINFSNGDYLGANAALLDGVLGRTGNGAGSGDAWSVSFWVKMTSTASGRVLFYFGSNDTTNGGIIEVRLTSSQKIRLQYGSNNNNVRLATPALTTGSWKHVLITYDGGTTGASSADINNYYSRFSIFVDGVSQTTSNSHSNYGWSGALSGQNFRIGKLLSGNTLNGERIDELAVWSSDESANVADIYNSGSTLDLTSLATSPSHWWRMGDGDTYPNIQDAVGSVTFVMYNMTAADIVTDAP